MKQLAEDSEPVGGSNHVALIVYKKNILSFGQNRLKSHPLQKQFSDHPEKIYLHAEMESIIRAIREVDEDILRKSTMYVARFGRSGRQLNSKPCDGCQKAIEFYQIKKVIHT